MGLALTNPGIQYEDQQPQIDPNTGQPLPVVPNVKFFKNKAARNSQYLADTAAAVNNTPLTIDSQTGAPSLGTPNIPKPVQPSFLKMETPNPDTGEPNAAPAGSETKLGKLVSILGDAARGAAYGAGQPNFGAGFQAAQERPIQMAQMRNAVLQQQAQTALTKSQSSMVQTPYGPLPAGLAKVMFPALIRSNSNEKIQWQKSATAESIQGQKSETAENVAGINKRFIPVQGVGLFDSQTRSVVPGSANGVTITPEIAQDHNLPQEFIGKPMTLQQLSSLQSSGPKTTTESQTTDLMGNTKTTRTTAPTSARPAANANGISPGFASFPQPQQPQAKSSGTGTPKPTATQPTSAPLIELPPDVEQRVSSSGLKPQEQQYVRGLLGYRGQMPSPRAKNYASTLATLTALDPNFNAANYDANRKTVMDYTPGGSVGKQALSFNTAIAHLNMLDLAAEAMNNKQLPFLNRIANAFKVQTGDSAVTTFKNIADAVDGEVAKTFKGTATEGELERVGAHFGSSLAPKQIQDNVRSTIGLLGGKMGEMESAFQRQVGRPIHMVSPEAAAAIQRMTASQQPTHVVTDAKGNRIGTVVNGQYVADGK